MPIVNQEMFATEIVRILVGSIGLILAVPITTFISARMLVKPAKEANSEQVKKEIEMLSHAGHHH